MRRIPARRNESLCVVYWSTWYLVQGTRKIPVQYAKRIVGNKQYGGVRQYIPLKVNSAGVMPIIFAQSLMFVPALVSQIWAGESDIANYIGTTFSDFTSWQYNALFATLIIVFTFFYTPNLRHRTRVRQLSHGLAIHFCHPVRRLL